MPLSGEAKTKYMREYMRHKRSGRNAAKAPTDSQRRESAPQPEMTLERFMEQNKQEVNAEIERRVRERMAESAKSKIDLDLGEPQAQQAPRQGDEQIDRLTALWKSGRDKYRSFFVELEAVRARIGDDALPNWCIRNLYIGISVIVETTKLLRDIDAKNAKEQLAAAREAEKAQKRSTQIDPASLSMSAQQKLDAAIRQHKRQLDLQFEHKLRTEIQKRIEETVLPAYNKERTEWRAIIKARKGIMDRATYRTILSCLHPDRVQDQGLKKKYEEAFRLFTDLEIVILNEKDAPTSNASMPKSYAEMMAQRQATTERRKAKRDAPKR